VRYVCQPKYCPPGQDQCITYGCNETTGECEPTGYFPNQTSCESDGNECTEDICIDGECAHVPYPNGTACAGGFCAGGACVPCVAPDCCVTDDNCTAIDLCLICAYPSSSDPSVPEVESQSVSAQSPAGTCVPKQCQPPASECETSACDNQTGECETAPKPNGTSCSSGVCLSGACVECITSADCPDDGDPCTDAACAQSNECAQVPHCFDGDVCTIDVCDPQTGACSYPPLCDDGEYCTADVCLLGNCYHFPDHCGELCNNGTGTCQRGVCVRFECLTDQDCQLPAEYCQDSTHTCQPVPDCDDGNVCTTGDAFDYETEMCTYSFAQAGTPCDRDSNNCTDDRCDGAGRCATVSTTECHSTICLKSWCSHSTGLCVTRPWHVGFSCLTDENSCTLQKCSQQGTCDVYETVNCDDGNECTVDSCSQSDPVTVTCEHARLANGTACSSDQDVCTVDECREGACAHVPIPRCCNLDSECDDGIECSRDRCDLETHRCRHKYPDRCCATDEQCEHDHEHEEQHKHKHHHHHQEQHHHHDEEEEDHDHEQRQDQDHAEHQSQSEHEHDHERTCVRDYCDATLHLCAFGRKPGCCQQDSDCADRDPCTSSERCDLENMTCVRETIEGCCARDSDCDDSDPCTRDECCERSHTCKHKPIRGCCRSDGDCEDDGNPCTVESCCEHKHRCKRALNRTACSCATHRDCWRLDNSDSCRVGLCDAGVCKQIDACDDGNAMTRDACTEEGACRHVQLSPRDDGGDAAAARVVAVGGECARVRARTEVGGDVRNAARYACPQWLSGGGGAAAQVTSTPLSIPEFHRYLDALGSAGEITDARAQCVPLGLGRFGPPFCGSPCDDQDPCTVDSCNPLYPYGEMCIHRPMNCDDSDMCTDDSCFEGACDHVARLCDQGFGCFSGDGLCYAVGDGGMCANKSCDDGDPCSIDLCNDVNGDCAHLPNSCADNDSCTLDVCVPGQGCANPLMPGVGTQNDTETACVVLLCDPVTGETAPYHKDCDDGDACTDDICVDSGTCVHRQPPYRDPECVPRGDRQQRRTVMARDEEERAESHHHDHHHGAPPPPPSYCRVEECMVFECIDSLSGNHTWTPAPAGKPCYLGDRCAGRYSCDGDGHCLLREGAPTECEEHAEEDDDHDHHRHHSPWVWIIAVACVLAAAVVIIGLVGLSFALRRRRAAE